MPQTQNPLNIDENDPKVKAKKVTVWLYDSATDTSTRLSSSNPIPTTTGSYATKVTVSGSITYVGLAAPGSSQASAVWQAKKIDETSGTVVTWADGNANFDNVATDLTTLTYS